MLQPGPPFCHQSPSPLALQAHYNTVLRLKQFFPFSLIDAMGSLEDTRAQIMRELRYQSSLDLQVCDSTACHKRILCYQCSLKLCQRPGHAHAMTCSMSPDSRMEVNVPGIHAAVTCSLPSGLTFRLRLTGPAGGDLCGHQAPSPGRRPGQGLPPAAGAPTGHVLQAPPEDLPGGEWSAHVHQSGHAVTVAENSLLQLWV